MRRLVFIALLGPLLVPAAYGQDSTNRKVLTFVEAVSIALNNAVVLNTQKNNLELSQVQKIGAYSGILPSVSGTASTQRTFGNSFNPVTGQVINGIRDNFSISANSNLNLFSGFYQINTIRQYVNMLDAQSYFVKRTAQDVINTVATQYLNVMLDVELVIIARANEVTLEKQLQQIREQVSLGAKGPVDEYNQAALAKAAELSWVQAQVQLDNDKALLAQTLLIDVSDGFVTERPSWDVNAIGSDVVNPGQMVEQAKQYRGDYLRALKNELGYKFGMKAAFGNMMPSLFAFGGVGSAYNFQHGIPKTVYDSSKGAYVPNTDYPPSFKKQLQVVSLYKYYGLQLNVRLFNGLQNRVLYVTQKVNYENAIQTRKNTEYQIKNDVARAVVNFEGAKRVYTITADKLNFAEKAVELEFERFNLGVTSFVEYANANKVLVQAQTDKAQAEYKLVFQKILLSYAAGTLKPEDVQQP
jgi:outer membrane protein